MNKSTFYATGIILTHPYFDEPESGWTARIEFNNSAGFYGSIETANFPNAIDACKAIIDVSESLNIPIVRSVMNDGYTTIAPFVGMIDDRTQNDFEREAKECAEAIGWTYGGLVR